MISIIIPAHNEEAVIARCLRSILDGADPLELEVIVACNGCTDRTAEVARQFGEPVRVITVRKASKTAALNVADCLARGFPRFYVDADVVLTIDAIRRIADLLEQGGGLVAWPEPRTDLSRSSWPVRAFYAVWARLPYNRSHGYVGAGVYALSREGRARFDRFPHVINDDGFVRFLFQPAERVSAVDACCQVQAPETLADLIRVKTRVRRGQYELGRRFPMMPNRERKNWRTLAGVCVSRPWLVLCLPVYVGVTLLVKWRARAEMSWGAGVWERDESSRRALDGSETAGGERA